MKTGQVTKIMREKKPPNCFFFFQNFGNFAGVHVFKKLFLTDPTCATHSNKLLCSLLGDTLTT